MSHCRFARTGRARAILALALAFLVALAADTAAQIARPLPGAARDASNQVGSGGINSPVPMQPVNTGNLFMTGNVAGGRQFRGYAPVRDASSLFAPLPTSHFSGFRADSIGVSDVVGGRSNYQVNPYFAPSQTVTNVGAIARGLNQPGSSIPLNPYTSPRAGVTSQWPGAAMPYAESLGTDPLTRPLDAEATWASPGPYSAIPRGGTAPAADPRAWALSRSPLFAPAAMQPFAAEAIPGTSPTGREPLIPPRTEPSVDTSGRLVAEYLQSSSRILSPRELAPRLFGDTTVPAEPSDTAAVGPPAVEPSTTVLDLGAAAAVTDPSARKTTDLYRPAGESVYEDFVGAVNWLRRAQPEGPEDAAPAAPTDVVGDFRTASEQARVMVGKALTSYAGSKESSVNRYIIEAEQRVREGRFYEAAGLYAVASRVDRDNPLIPIGHGQALLLAGDYVTSVYHLTRGLRKFDMVAYFKIDLGAFIPDPNLLDKRRADLEQRLESRESYPLRFLLGYAEYYSGLEKFGLPNLKKAADEARQAIDSAAVSGPDLLTATVIAEFSARLTGVPALPAGAAEK